MAVDPGVWLLFIPFILIILGSLIHVIVFVTRKKYKLEFWVFLVLFISFTIITIGLANSFIGVLA